jgi:hypothetical protein
VLNVRVMLVPALAISVDPAMVNVLSVAWRSGWLAKVPIHVTVSLVLILTVSGIGLKLHVTVTLAAFTTVASSTPATRANARRMYATKETVGAFERCIGRAFRLNWCGIRAYEVATGNTNAREPFNTTTDEAVTQREAARCAASALLRHSALSAASCRKPQLPL